MPDKNDKFTKTTLSTDAIHEVGKKYWSGCWSKWYTVLDAQHDIHGKNTVLKSVTVQWEDGTVNTHATPLDPQKDFELRNMEQAQEPPRQSATAVGELHYVYSDETIKYSDPQQLIADYKEAINTQGVNAVSAAVLTEDVEQAVELGYSILSIKAGEYGYYVDKKHYIELAKQHGATSPMVGEAIVDAEEMYNRMERRRSQQNEAELSGAEMEV